MMFRGAQEKKHWHQLVPANSSLSNATTNISFVFAVGSGRISTIMDLREAALRTPGQGSGIPEHPSGYWQVSISLQSCDYSSYRDTKCNFDL